MKKIIYIFLLLCAPMKSFPQETFNKIIPFDYSPTINEVIDLEDEVLIAVNHFIENSVSTTIISHELETFFTTYKYILHCGLGRSSFNRYENRFFLAGDNFDGEGNYDTKFIEIDKELNIITEVNFENLIDKNAVLQSQIVDDNMYIIGIKEHAGNIQRELTLRKIGLNGSQKWYKTYFPEYKYTYSWGTSTTLDGHLLLNNGVVYKHITGRHPQLVKIAPNGNIIWEYVSDETTLYLNSKNCGTSLSNGNYLLVYPDDKRNDIDYWINDWHFGPIIFEWVDRSGVFIKNNLTIFKAKLDIDFKDLEAGRGDYFFGYGKYWDSEFDNYYGFITKYSNDGDTIWSHKYIYSDQDSTNIYHTINDIYERENGDIIVLGSRKDPWETKEIWLFFINENGCMSDEDCEEIIVKAKGVTYSINSQIDIYPNPAHSYLDVHLNGNTHWNTWTIHSTNGQLMKESKAKEHNDFRIDGLEGFPPGLYFLKMTSKDEITTTGKFIKG